MKKTAPVLFLIFNRPELTSRVFSAIREAKPAKLYVAADGPRTEIADEPERCLETRAIMNQVDWPCDVRTFYRGENVGCKRAVSSALDWFFENEEEGIILEDDCLPNPEFFDFCSELLDRYRDTSEVHHISGINLQNGIQRGEGSYYFSVLPHIWGWATWRRAWNFYDVALYGDGPEARNDVVETTFQSPEEKAFWLVALDSVASGHLDTWDIQRCYSMWRNQGIAILPNRNLVSNLGFGPDATHTKSRSPLAEMPNFPIGRVIHPNRIDVDRAADWYTFETVFR